MHTVRNIVQGLIGATTVAAYHHYMSMKQMDMNNANMELQTSLRIQQERAEFNKERDKLQAEINSLRAENNNKKKLWF
jgi:uncharacterized protein YlxW (UPF0749 family)